jgi:hypothetical protein
MKKLLKIVLLSSVPLVMFSCYYDEFPEEIEASIPEIPEEQVVSFNDDITPIFVDYNCTECHSPGGQNPDLTPGREYNSLVPAYVTAGDPDNSKLYTQLAGGHRNVDATSIALIKKWITDGAENN